MSTHLIIGGGIAGLSAAARLSEHVSVTVIEQESVLGYHASGRSAALFEPNYGNPAVQALSRPGEEFFVDGGYLSPRGFLLLGHADADNLFDKDLADLGAEEISIGDALARVPILNQDHVTRAAFNVGARDIDTDRLLQDFARTVRRNGGSIHTDERVADITKTSQGWDVVTNTTTHSATCLINAAGPWADHIAALAGISPINLTPYRRSMARIKAPDDHDISNWPVFFGAGETWYAKPDAGQLIVSPADEDPSEPMDAWPDDMVLAEGLARYDAAVTTELTRPTSTWAGLRSFAPDRALVLGPEPDCPSFVWCAAQGGYGFQTAPEASQLVRDLTLGRTARLSPDIIKRLSPARFR
jgi:glycine/D-amino acid oxidase-like deaminating enzyme